MTDATPFDPAVITQLVQDTGGDVAFVRDLVDTFAAEAPTLLRQVHEADGDLEAQRRAAHTLASNAGTLGALELSRLARAVEYTARDGTAPSPAAIDEVGAALHAALGAIDALDVWK